MEKTGWEIGLKIAAEDWEAKFAGLGGYAILVC